METTESRSTTYRLKSRIFIFEKEWQIRKGEQVNYFFKIVTQIILVFSSVKCLSLLLMHRRNLSQGIECKHNFDGNQGQKLQLQDKAWCATIIFKTEMVKYLIMHKNKKKKKKKKKDKRWRARNNPNKCRS